MKKKIVSLALSSLFLTLAILGIQFILPVEADPAVWTVGPGKQFATIQEALSNPLLVPGDIIEVYPSTYYENVVVNIGVTIRSVDGPEVTIVDGNFIDTVFTILTDATIDGFTVRNGLADYGGGIYCYNVAPTILNNIIINNSAEEWGGGIFCDSSSPTITGNTITNNSALGVLGFGGGISCSNHSSPTIQNNQIIENFADCGGGISCEYSSSPMIQNNQIKRNSADHAAAGVNCYSFCSPMIQYNVITENSATQWAGGIGCDHYSSPTIRRNTITGNSAELYHAGGIICFDHATPTITYCTISDNNPEGIFCAESSSPTIHRNDITDNIGYGIQNIDAAITVDAKYNWWGDSSGPSGVGPGTGDEVSDYVDYDSWLHKSAIITVGGVWVPVDKLGLLAPYIGLASTILVATVATAIYIKRRKEKQ